jgi:hypothetical protein
MTDRPFVIPRSAIRVPRSFPFRSQLASGVRMFCRLRSWVVAHPRAVAVGLGLASAAAAALYWFVLRPDPGDPRLAAFVRARPPVPVVFTSRTEPASFEAAAPDGEEFRYPGRRPWAAREGRLRVLTPRGTVHELTWGKRLPDGGTLVDVMSPSVTLDGKKVLFAGRKGGDDPGHFRLYEVYLDGSELRQLTGGPDDAGAMAAPPMRFGPDGSVLPDAERRRIDYDDVDPVELRAEPREIVFASSRTPDLGRDHARRSTTLWLFRDGKMSPASGNRNNDRWPFVLTSGYVAFSLWSRNREVITADETDIRPYDPAVPSATRPTDNWLGAFIRVSHNQPHFGMLVKPDVPVWRVRPLFNGRLAFMTPAPGGGLTVVQAEPGLIGYVAAAKPIGAELPDRQETRLRHGPESDADGRPLWLATPSPCPPGGILLSAAPVEPGRSSPEPGRYGLYLASDDWPESGASAAGTDLRLLFDDPDFVDAEPVAAYPRKANLAPLVKLQTQSPPEVNLTLAGGKPYRGTAGVVMVTGIYSAMMNDLPGQQTDLGEGPVFGPPPPGAIDRVKIYMARRDRFDDPARPRVPGGWELLMELRGPDAGEATGGRLPALDPTVLAAFGADGKVVKWTTAAKDARGRRATFYAFAGDHYSLTSPGVQSFCVGCHPGHSGLPREAHKHAERVGE